MFAGTILENGTLQIRADRVGEDTTSGKIIELVEEAQDSKSEAERFIDGFLKWYTPAVLVGAFITWLISQDVELAITVLVLGCPGALVIGVPVSNVAGIGNGARNGVLLKGSEVAEMKTYGDADLALSYLASVENESDHPLAKAILNELNGAEMYDVDEPDVVKGGGIVAEQRVVVGNVALMEKEKVAMNEEVLADVAAYEKRGNSLVLTAVDGELKAIMGIRDQIRAGMKDDLQELKHLGVKNLIVLSGDNQGTVDLVAEKLGLTKAHVIHCQKINQITSKNYKLKVKLSPLLETV